MKVHVHLCATHVALACEPLWVDSAVSAGVCVGGGINGCGKPKSAVWSLRCGGMCVYGVSITRQPRDMRLDGTVGVCECYGIEWSDRSFAGLHCTDEGQQPETSTWMSAVCQD